MTPKLSHLIKVHEDIITLPEVMDKLYTEYENMGYKMSLKLPFMFQYILEDKTIVTVFWDNGTIYERIANLSDDNEHNK